MVAEPQAPLLSADEYIELESESEVRHEFIDGHMYALAGGTINHGLLCVAVTSVLRELLLDGPCRPCPSDVRVQVSEERYVYPDASVTCDERDRGDLSQISHPRVIVEVLSRSTEAYDRGDKFGYYRACPTVEEYMLVSGRRREIEVYRRSGQIWALNTFGSGDEVELTSIGIRFPETSIYAGIELTGTA